MLAIIGRSMKFLLKIVALSLLLTACNRRDTKLGQQVAGTWTRDQSGAMTFAADGSFSSVLWKSGHTNSFAGTWQIRDRVLIMTLTNASDAKAGSLVGGVERYNIIRVDDRQLVYEESGQTHTLTR